MRITVVGTGYVGLVTGSCLADVGRDVVCVDIDAGKIARLQARECPIYEPELAELIQRNRRDRRWRSTAEPADGIGSGEVCFMAVGTPGDQDGCALP